MIKYHCDICGKEINQWRSDLNIPITVTRDAGWNSKSNRECINHTCKVCQDRIDEFIQEMITQSEDE